MMQGLIIANGTVPSKTFLRPLVRSADVIICADGGANQARRLHITPDVIIGDFDSITPATKRHFSHVRQIVISDQDSTDLEKAIRFCIRQRLRHVDIVGASGDRLDHVTGTLGCFRKFGKKIRLRLIDNVGELTLLPKSVRLRTRPGERLSLIPLGRCAGIETTHLRYPLHSEALELGVREGISNEATATTVTIGVGSGTLLLYRFR